jgi:hypothetical protein
MRVNSMKTLSGCIPLANNIVHFDGYLDDHYHQYRGHCFCSYSGWSTWLSAHMVVDLYGHSVGRIPFGRICCSISTNYDLQPRITIGFLDRWNVYRI